VEIRRSAFNRAPRDIIIRYNNSDSSDSSELAHWFLLVTFGMETRALIMQVGNCLYTIRVGKQRRLEAEYANAAYAVRNGERLIFFCRARVALVASPRSRLLFRLLHKILPGLWYSTCPSTTCVLCAHAPWPTVTFRLKYAARNR